jgi:GntR family transcriptional repressor for pyruvate dehydrogenase complex
MNDFRPIKKTTVSGEIIEQVIAMVRAGSLKPGDKLPSERQLGEFLGVGRSSIREALKGLQTAGLLKRTTGGTVLCEPEEVDHPAFWYSAINTNIRAVFETRKLMEIDLVALAAERATREDIRRIRETIVETLTVDQVRSSDIAFHRAIVEAAKNAVFSQVYSLVTGLLFQTHKYYSLLGVYEPVESLKRNLIAQHREIANAIESHDAEAAREAMRHHLGRAEKELLGKVGMNLSKRPIRYSARESEASPWTSPASRSKRSAPKIK